MTGPRRHEPAFPNTAHVARREYRELVRSRLFHVSTVILMVLAVGVALIPIAVRLVERGGTTRIAVVAQDASLGTTTQNILTSFMNFQGGARYTVELEP